MFSPSKYKFVLTVPVVRPGMGNSSKDQSETNNLVIYKNIPNAVLLIYLWKMSLVFKVTKNAKNLAVVQSLVC